MDIISKCFHFYGINFDKQKSKQGDFLFYFIFLFCQSKQKKI